MIFLFLITCFLVFISDDFVDINLIKTDPSLFILIALVIIIALIATLAYKKYKHAVEYLQNQSSDINTLIDRENASKKYDFNWQIGEYGLWVCLNRHTIDFKDEHMADLDFITTSYSHEEIDQYENPEFNEMQSLASLDITHVLKTNHH